jgi:CRISPR-associated protein Cas6
MGAIHVTFVDLGFPVTGPGVPRDHGYPLYAALCGAVPALHGATWLGVHPLSGTLLDEGTLALRDHTRLFLRLPAERIPDVLPLAGRAIDIGSARLVLGAPNVSALVPAASLDARLVVIKLTDAPHRENQDLGRETLDIAAFAERYTAELKRQLAALDIPSTPELCGRHSITVSGKRIVGYSVRVSGLSADQSLVLQVNGLGGKRRMGCGMFRKTRGKVPVP